MLKKVIPYLLLVLFLGWAFYRFFVTRPIEQTTPAPSLLALDWEKLDATTSSAVKEIPATIKIDERNLQKKPEESSEKGFASKEDFAQFDQMEKEWLKEVAHLVGEKNYPVYLEMRAKNEKEKLQAYQEYHDSLKKKYGDHFSYNISEDQSVEEKKINQFYLKKLFLLIGEEKFKVYLQARDKINEEKRKNDQASLQIEF